MRWFGLTLGAIVGIAHIGMLGHIMSRTQFPVVNLPVGDYTTYKVEVGKDGYTIEYKSNDPKVLSTERSLNVDRTKKGLFGGGSEKRDEYRRDEYTAEGYRNLQGGAAVDGEGKSAEEIECIVEDAGARSQGAMAGTSVAAGVLIPAVANIPYIGWLATGWALLLGQKVGSQIGSEVGSVFNDC